MTYFIWVCCIVNNYIYIHKYIMIYHNTDDIKLIVLIKTYRQSQQSEWLLT